MIALGISPQKRKQSMQKGARRSFVGGSFIGGDGSSPGVYANETPEEREKREKEEFKNSFRIMTYEESQREMARKDFNAFLEKTGRIIERALDQDFDVVGDFFAEDEEEDGEKRNRMKNDKISQAFVFQPAKNLKRMVTSMDWSPTVGELILVSYSKCLEQRYDEPDGMVNIFSTNLKTRPEYTLYCQNEVTKAIFNPFQPNIVIGAT